MCTEPPRRALERCRVTLLCGSGRAKGVEQPVVGLSRHPPIRIAGKPNGRWCRMTSWLTHYSCHTTTRTPPPAYPTRTQHLARTRLPAATPAAAHRGRRQQAAGHRGGFRKVGRRWCLSRRGRILQQHLMPRPGRFRAPLLLRARAARAPMVAAAAQAAQPAQPARARAMATSRA